MEISIEEMKELLQQAYNHGRDSNYPNVNVPYVTWSTTKNKSFVYNPETGEVIQTTAE